MPTLAGSVGSVGLWASWLRILLSSSKNSKKTLDSYCLGLLFDLLSKLFTLTIRTITRERKPLRCICSLKPPTDMKRLLRQRRTRVGSGRATCPCAARTLLYMLINHQSRALCTPPAHRSFATLMLISLSVQSTMKRLDQCSLHPLVKHPENKDVDPRPGSNPGSQRRRRWEAEL